jgi:hypothetical protein
MNFLRRLFGRGTKSSTPADPRALQPPPMPPAQPKTLPLHTSPKVSGTPPAKSAVPSPGSAVRPSNLPKAAAGTARLMSPNCKTQYHIGVNASIENSERMFLDKPSVFTSGKVYAPNISDSCEVGIRTSDFQYRSAAHELDICRSIRAKLQSGDRLTWWCWSCGTLKSGGNRFPSDF